MMVDLPWDFRRSLVLCETSPAAEEIAMQTIRVLEKTGKDGMLSLRIPLGRAEAEYDVLVVVQPNVAVTTPEDRGWPPGYFDLAGSIDDETFVRAPQGELPKVVGIE
jgi:hypothetical protein